MKKISLFLAISFILSYLGIFSVFAATNLVLTGSPDSYITTGVNKTHTVTVKNTSSEAIKDIGLDISTSGIGATSTQLGLFTLQPNESKNVDVNLYGEVGIGGATRRVSLNFSYISKSGSPVIDTLYFNITVTDNPATESPGALDNKTPNVVMTSPTSVISLNAGEQKTVDVIFENSGNTAANSLIIIPEASADLSVSAKSPASANNTLTVNSTQTVRVSISADKDLKSGSYPVNFKFTYYDANRKQYTGTSSFYVKVENDSSTINPNVVLKNYVMSPENVIGGNQFTLTATIENNSSVAAKNIQVNISGLAANVISMSNAANNTYFATLAPNESKSISFSLNAYEKLKTNSYPITLTLKYENTKSNAEQKDFSSEYTYYVGVTNKDGIVSDSNKALLSVISTSAPTKTYDTGEAFPVSLTLQNSGKLSAKNIKITATTPEGVVPKSSNVQQILSLNPDETKVVNFSFAPNSLSKTQNYSIEFKIEYENGLEADSEGDTIKETDSFVQYVGANILNSKADKDKDDDDDKLKSIPKIIVSNYKIEPQIVQAGQEFDLYLTFQNTHSTKTVNNIKAVLTVPLNSDKEKVENAFSPVDASNTFFIDSISPKDTYDEHLKLYTVLDAAAKNHIIVIEFDYEDDDGNPITQKEEVGVTVRQKTGMELGEIYMPTNAMVGDPIYLDFSIQNTGKVTLNNLKIKVVGDGFRTADSELILGNFESGDSEYYNGNFTPEQPGDLTANLIISYDNDLGEHIEDVRDFKIMVAEMMIDPGMMEGEILGPDGMPIQFGPDGMPIEEGSGGGIWGFVKSNWIWITVGAVVAIAAISGGIVFIARKKQKGLDFDE